LDIQTTKRQKRKLGVEGSGSQHSGLKKMGGNRWGIGHHKKSVGAHRGEEQRKKDSTLLCIVSIRKCQRVSTKKQGEDGLNNKKEEYSNSGEKKTEKRITKSNGWDIGSLISSHGARGPKKVLWG